MLALLPLLLACSVPLSSAVLNLDFVNSKRTSLDRPDIEVLEDQDGALLAVAEELASHYFDKYKNESRRIELQDSGILLQHENCGDFCFITVRCSRFKLVEETAPTDLRVKEFSAAATSNSPSFASNEKKITGVVDVFGNVFPNSREEIFSEGHLTKVAYAELKGPSCTAPNFEHLDKCVKIRGSSKFVPLEDHSFMHANYHLLHADTTGLFFHTKSYEAAEIIFSVIIYQRAASNGFKIDEKVRNVVNDFRKKWLAEELLLNQLIDSKRASDFANFILSQFYCGMVSDSGMVKRKELEGNDAQLFFESYIVLSKNTVRHRNPVQVALGELEAASGGSYTKITSGLLNELKDSERKNLNFISFYSVLSAKELEIAVRQEDIFWVVTFTTSRKVSDDRIIPLAITELLDKANQHATAHGALNQAATIRLDVSSAPAELGQGILDGSWESLQEGCGRQVEPNPSLVFFRRVKIVNEDSTFCRQNALGTLMSDVFNPTDTTLVPATSINQEFKSNQFLLCSKSVNGCKPYEVARAEKIGFWIGASKNGQEFLILLRLKLGAAQPFNTPQINFEQAFTSIKNLREKFHLTLNFEQSLELSSVANIYAQNLRAVNPNTYDDFTIEVCDDKYAATVCKYSSPFTTEIPPSSDLESFLATILTEIIAAVEKFQEERAYVHTIENNFKVEENENSETFYPRNKGKELSIVSYAQLIRESSTAFSVSYSHICTPEGQAGICTLFIVMMSNSPILTHDYVRATSYFHRMRSEKLGITGETKIHISDKVTRIAKIILAQLGPNGKLTADKGYGRTKTHAWTYVFAKYTGTRFETIKSAIDGILTKEFKNNLGLPVSTKTNMEQLDQETILLQYGLAFSKTQLCDKYALVQVGFAASETGIVIIFLTRKNYDYSNGTDENAALDKIRRHAVTLHPLLQEGLEEHANRLAEVIIQHYKTLGEMYIEGKNKDFTASVEIKTEEFPVELEDYQRNKENYMRNLTKCLKNKAQYPPGPRYVNGLPNAHLKDAFASVTFSFSSQDYDLLAHGKYTALGYACFDRVCATTAFYMQRDHNTYFKDLLKTLTHNRPTYKFKNQISATQILCAVDLVQQTIGRKTASGIGLLEADNETFLITYRQMSTQKLGCKLGDSNYIAMKLTLESLKAFLEEPGRRDNCRGGSLLDIKKTAKNNNSFTRLFKGTSLFDLAVLTTLPGYEDGRICLPVFEYADVTLALIITPLISSDLSNLSRVYLSHIQQGRTNSNLDYANFEKQSEAILQNTNFETLSVWVEKYAVVDYALGSYIYVRNPKSEVNSAITKSVTELECINIAIRNQKYTQLQNHFVSFKSVETQNVSVLLTMDYPTFFAECNTKFARKLSASLSNTTQGILKQKIEGRNLESGFWLTDTSYAMTLLKIPTSLAMEPAAKILDSLIFNSEKHSELVYVGNSSKWENGLKLLSRNYTQLDHIIRMQTMVEIGIAVVLNQLAGLEYLAIFYENVAFEKLISELNFHRVQHDNNNLFGLDSHNIKKFDASRLPKPSELSSANTEIGILFHQNHFVLYIISQMGYKDNSEMLNVFLDKINGTQSDRGSDIKHAEAPFIDFRPGRKCLVGLNPEPAFSRSILQQTTGNDYHLVEEKVSNIAVLYVAFKPQNSFLQDAQLEVLTEYLKFSGTSFRQMSTSFGDRNLDVAAFGLAHLWLQRNKLPDQPEILAMRNSVALISKSSNAYPLQKMLNTIPNDLSKNTSSYWFDLNLLENGASLFQFSCTKQLLGKFAKVAESEVGISTQQDICVFLFKMPNTTEKESTPLRMFAMDVAIYMSDKISHTSGNYYIESTEWKNVVEIYYVVVDINENINGQQFERLILKRMANKSQNDTQNYQFHENVWIKQEKTSKTKSVDKHKKIFLGATHVAYAETSITMRKWEWLFGTTEKKVMLGLYVIPITQSDNRRYSGAK